MIRWITDTSWAEQQNKLKLATACPWPRATSSWWTETAGTSSLLYILLPKQICCVTRIIAGTTSTFWSTCTAISMWCCFFVATVHLPGCIPWEIIQILWERLGIAVIMSVTDNPPKALSFALRRIHKGISKDLYSHVLIHQLPISFSCFSCLPQINTLPNLAVNAAT